MLTVVHTGKRTGECSVILSIEQEEKTFLPSALFEKIALKTRLKLANFCKWDACIGKPLCQGKADKMVSVSLVKILYVKVKCMCLLFYTP